MWLVRTGVWGFCGSRFLKRNKKHAVCGTCKASGNNKEYPSQKMIYPTSVSLGPFLADHLNKLIVLLIDQLRVFSPRHAKVQGQSLRGMGPTLGVPCTPFPMTNATRGLPTDVALQNCSRF
jgi:hypothetical protein